MLLNAGAEGSVYPDFKPFTSLEIHHVIALYILQGLFPSPQVKMKFKPQHINPVNGHDLCCKVFGVNTDKCHKMFKAFFGLQDA